MPPTMHAGTAMPGVFVSTPMIKRRTPTPTTIRGQLKPVTHDQRPGSNLADEKQDTEQNQDDAARQVPNVEKKS